MIRYIFLLFVIRDLENHGANSSSLCNSFVFMVTLADLVLSNEQMGK